MSKPLLYLGNLSAPEGNAFVILGRAKRVADENKLDWLPIEQDATSGDYEHLLDVMREHFDARVEGHIEMDEL